MMSGRSGLGRLGRWRGRHGLLERLSLVAHAVLRCLGLNGALRGGSFGLFLRSRLRGRGNGHGQGTRPAHVLRQSAGDVLPQLSLNNTLGILVRGGNQRVAIPDHDGLYELEVEALAVGEVGNVRVRLFGLCQQITDHSFPAGP